MCLYPQFRFSFGLEFHSNDRFLHFVSVTSTKPYLVVGVTGVNFESEKQESMVSFVDLNRMLQNDYPIPSDVHIVEHDNHTIQGR